MTNSLALMALANGRWYKYQTAHKKCCTVNFMRILRPMPKATTNQTAPRKKATTKKATRKRSARNLYLDTDLVTRGTSIALKDPEIGSLSRLVEHLLVTEIGARKGKR